MALMGEASREDLSEELHEMDVDVVGTISGVCVLDSEEDLRGFSRRYLSHSSTELRVFVSPASQDPQPFPKRCVSPEEYFFKGSKDFCDILKEFFSEVRSPESPLRVFTPPGCCLLSSRIPPGRFETLFTAVLQSGHPPSVRRLAASCRKLVRKSVFRTRCLCSTKGVTRVEGLDTKLRLITGLFFCLFTSRRDYVPTTFLKELTRLTHVGSEGATIKNQPQDYLRKAIVEVIDGVNFITFESEEDMLEYTRMERSRSCEPPQPLRIVPTKTRDITKIKGWKNKLFNLDEANICDPELEAAHERLTAFSHPDAFSLDKLSSGQLQFDIPVLSTYTKEPTLDMKFRTMVVEHVPTPVDDSMLFSSGKRHKDYNKRPHLSLLDDYRSDDDDDVQIPELPKKRLPLIVRCASDNHSSCLQVKTYYLGAVMHLGRRRPVPKALCDNLDLLRKDSNVIDALLANVAVSALNVGVRRIVVPVVCEVIKSLAESCIQDADRSLELGVASVVKDLVEYVVRKEALDALDFPEDPDAPETFPEKQPSRKHEKASKVERELRRLVNVTLVDDSESSGTCKEDACMKGCVCRSLQGKAEHTHCGKEACMFDCVCADKADFRRKSSLAKEESAWTVVRNKDLVEMRGDNAKRRKKLPKRFRHNVLLGKEMFSLNVVGTKPQKARKTRTVLSIEPEDDLHIDETPKSLPKLLQMADSPEKTVENDPLELPPKKSPKTIVPPTTHRPMTHQPMVHQPRSATRQPKFGEIFIWCSIHSCYTCTCNAFVYFLRCSSLLWRPSPSLAKMSIQSLKELLKSSKNVSSIGIYQYEDHSARTIGSLINYTKRNSSKCFRDKRAAEVDNFVLTYTNSFVKLELPTKTFSRNPRLDPIVRETVVDETVPRPRALKQRAYGFLDPTFFNNIKTQFKDFELKVGPGDERKKYRIGPAHFEARSKLRPFSTKPEIQVEERARQREPRGKRNYRIGPAHFHKSGSRTIMTRPVLSDVCPGPSASSNTLPTEGMSEKKEFEFCLMSLTRGLGYFPVKENSSERLLVQDPLVPTFFHTFKDVKAANIWYNRFFKNRMLFEELNVNLSWVLVKKALVATLPPFDKSIIENNQKMINREGLLVDKITRDAYVIGRPIQRATPGSPEQRNVNKRSAGSENGVSPISGETALKKIKLTSSTTSSDEKEIKQDSVMPKKLAILGEEKSFELPSSSSESLRPGRGASLLRIDTNSRMAEGRFIPLVISDRKSPSTSSPDEGKRKIILKNKQGIVLARVSSSSFQPYQPSERSLLKK